MGVFVDKDKNITRMHSSRMRTARSSSHCGGVWSQSPSISPLGCGPGSDLPEFLPWVWAWRGVSLAEGVSLAGGFSLAGGSPWQGGIPGRGVLPGGGSPWWGVSLARGSPWGVSLAWGLPDGGSPWQGVSLEGGLLGGGLLGGGRGSPWQTPLLTEWQMPVKI